jgi:hypothetical protein
MTMDEYELRDLMRERGSGESVPANPGRVGQIGGRIARRRRRRSAAAVLGGAAAMAVVAALGVIRIGGSQDGTDRVAARPQERPSAPAVAQVPPELPARLIDPDGEESPVRRIAGRTGVWPRDGKVALTVPYRGKELSVVVACTGGSAASLMTGTSIRGRINSETGKPAEGGSNCTTWPMPAPIRVPPQGVMTIPEGTRKVTIDVRVYQADLRAPERKVEWPQKPTGWSVAVYERE